MPKEHNGHRSWNAWNVSLWISNEEWMYGLAVECAKESRHLEDLTRKFIIRSCLLGDRTPDGATYNRLSIKLALEGLELTYGRAA